MRAPSRPRILQPLMPITINMATSLDGKIAPADRSKVRLGSDEDIVRLDLLRAWADVVVIGAGTVRAEDPPMGIRDPSLQAEREQAGRPCEPAVAVVTASLDIPAGRFFEGSGRRIVVTTDEARGPGAALTATAEVWRMGAGRVDPTVLAGRLLAEGLERILVEGGGGLAAAFLEAGIVDEVRLTITPWLLGGDAAPTIADAGHLFGAPARFEYVDVDPREDEVFVTLRRKDDIG